MKSNKKSAFANYGLLLALVTLSMGSILVQAGTSESDSALELGKGTVFKVAKGIPVQGRSSTVVLCGGSAAPYDWFGFTTCVLELTDSAIHAQDYVIPNTIPPLKVKTNPDWVTDGSGYNKMRVKYEFEANPYFKNMDCDGGGLARMQTPWLKIGNVKYQLGDYMSIIPSASAAASSDSAKNTENAIKPLAESASGTSSTNSGATGKSAK